MGNRLYNSTWKFKRLMVINCQKLEFSALQTRVSEWHALPPHHPDLSNTSFGLSVSHLAVTTRQRSCRLRCKWLSQLSLRTNSVKFY